MAFPRKLLGEGETVVVHTRTHAKALFWPALAFVVLGGLTGAGLAAVPTATGSWARVAILLVALAAVGFVCARPFLGWWSSTYTVTDRRVVTRTGVLHTRGRDVPLLRVTDVSYDRSLSDRMLRCGTINVATASEQGALVLPDVPEVEHVHLAMTELLFDGHRDPDRVESRS